MATDTDATHSTDDLTAGAAIVRSLLALLLGCVVIWFVETLYVAFALESLPESVRQRGAFGFVAGVAAVSGIVFLINAVAPVIVGHLLHRKTRWWWLFPVIVGGVFGFLWQETIIHGDGLVSRADYPTIRIASMSLATLGGATAAAVLAKFPERDASLGPTTLPFFVMLAASVYVNAAILPRYVEFHGFLAAFNGLFAAWLVWPLLERKPWRIAALTAGAMLVAATAVTYAQHDDLLRYVKRFGHTPRAMASHLPISRSVENALDLEGVMGPMSPAQVERHLPALEGRGEFDARRGRNILLIVLESTRADTWSSADVTPRFHDWKQTGLYAPNAVAQYPATPLAYGAMFTSQPPAVLAGSPYWSTNRPFAPVAESFDRIIATRPDVSWFDTNAISDFLLPDSAVEGRHTSAEQGLAYVREQLEAAPDASFFAWAHLYEPHQPWERRDAFATGDGKAAAYRSEVAYTDSALGDFIDWFRAQPFADDTLLVLVSDHGEGLGEVIEGSPYWGHHVHVRNVVSHIPLFVSGPGIPKDATRADLGVQQMDLLPTFYDFVGKRPSDELLLQGHSVYALLARDEPRPLVTQSFSFRGHAFFDFVDRAQKMHPEDMRRAFDKTTITSSRYAPKIAMQLGNYKLIRDEWLQDYRLYDIEADPGETRDLAGSHPDVLATMKGRLAAWEMRQRAVIQRLNRGMRSVPSD